VARTIFADPDSVVAWGPPNATRALAVEGGYRLSGSWDFASGCRQGQLDGRALSRQRGRWLPAPE
jgi:hypothetical protein